MNEKSQQGLKIFGDQVDARSRMGSTGGKKAEYGAEGDIGGWFSGIQ